MKAPVVDTLHFQQHGFVIVRNVLDASEVARIRGIAEAAAERAKAQGVIVKPRSSDEIAPIVDLVGLAPALAEIVFDERLIAIARALLGKDAIVYFGDSGVMVGGRARGFHKDNTCRDDPMHPDWRTPYTLIRMGLYLEDHDRFSGGLKVRAGSHLRPDVSSGAIVDVPTRAGDVVIWSLRTTHSGHAVRVRGLPWLRLSPRFEQRLPNVLAIDEPCRRVALFISYGLDDAHLERYVAKHADGVTYPDNYLYKGWLYSDPSPRWEDLARSRGVVLKKPIAEWGRLHGTANDAGKYIPIGSSKPDVYPVGRGEALIRTVGSVVRRLSRPTTSEGISA